MPGAINAAENGGAIERTRRRILEHAAVGAYAPSLRATKRVEDLLRVGSAGRRKLNTVPQPL